MISEFSSEIWNGVLSSSFSAALLGHEFERTPGDSTGRGSPLCLQCMGLQSQTRLIDSTTIPWLVGSSFTGQGWKVGP